MSESRDRRGGRPYKVALSALILILVGLAGASLFMATGGSLFGWSSGVFGISERPTIDAMLRRARQAAWRGDYEAAVAGFDTAVAALPGDRAVALERAQVLGWAQRYGAAADALAEVEDSDVETRLERARYLWWAGRPLEADSLLSLLLREDAELQEARELQQLVRPSIEPAETVARRWVEERPTDPFARLWLARALVESGRLAGSLAHYRVALGQTGTVEPDVLLEAAGVALGADSLALAGEILLRYLHDVDPTDVETRLRLARAYAWSGRRAEAAEQYRQVLAAAPDPYVRLELARVLARDGRHQAARAEYRRVLAARPSPMVRRELVRVLALRREYDAAVREMERVVRQSPTPDRLTELAELLSLAERYPEAAAVLARVLEQRPDAHAVRLRRARLLWWSQRSREADAELNTLLLAQPGNVEARELRTEVRESIDVTLELARTWAELDDTPENRLRFARELVEAERYGAAVPEYRAVLASAATRELVVEAVDAAEAADSLDAATELLASYLAGTTDRELLRRLGRLQGWNDQPGAAAETYARYLDRYPDDTKVRFARAQQLAWQDSTTWDSSMVELEQVVADDPTHEEALKLLGDLHRWTGQPEQALAYYERAEALNPDMDGLAEGMQLASRARSQDAAQDATRVAWVADLDAFTDSEGFDWIASGARRSWGTDRASLGLEIGQRYSSGLAGTSGSFGGRAALLGRYRFATGLTAVGQAGVTSFGDTDPFPTWGAGVEYSDSTAFAKLQYDRAPAVRDATTYAALRAEAVIDRLLLRALYEVGAWQAAADLQLQAFSADVGSTDRYAGTVRLDRSLGSGWAAGALVRGIFATSASPSLPGLGPLYWAPVRYVAPALSVRYGTPIGSHWWLGLRASPGYAFIEERSTGLARYRTGETAIVETGATVGYRSGPWSLSVSGDVGGALPDGYRSSTLRIELSRIGGGP